MELAMVYELTSICGCQVSADAERLRSGELLMYWPDRSGMCVMFSELRANPEGKGVRGFGDLSELRRLAESRLRLDGSCQDGHCSS